MALCINIKDIKGIFHAKIGMTKGRNSKDQIEAEEIKWQEHRRTLHTQKRS